MKKHHKSPRPKRKQPSEPKPPLVWLEMLRAVWVKLSAGTVLWPVVFWTWVVWVSFWIDSAPAQVFTETQSLQQYSDIQFGGMHFEQKYEDNTQISVTTQKARFDSSTKILYLDRPVMEWKDLKDGRTFTAHADRGEVQSVMDESSLPAEFRILKLFGHGRAEGKDTSVEAETMTFDCDTKEFVCPPPSVFYQGKFKSKFQQTSVFYPLEGRMETRP